MPDPKPTHPPIARASWPHRTVTNDLKPGATIPALGAKYFDIAIAGASQVRIRGKVNKTTTVDTLFLRPDGVTPYEENQPEQLDVTADEEFIGNVSPCGESILRVRVNGHATDVTTVAYVDTMALPTA